MISLSESSTFCWCVGTPKITLRPSGLLKGLTDSVPATLTVYYNEMIQMKVSKGKRHKARSPGETRHNLAGGHPQWSYREALNSPRRIYDWPRAGEWPAREAHLNLGAQGFYLGACRGIQKENGRIHDCPHHFRPRPHGNLGEVLYLSFVHLCIC